MQNLLLAGQGIFHEPVHCQHRVGDEPPLLSSAPAGPRRRRIPGRAGQGCPGDSSPLPHAFTSRKEGPIHYTKEAHFETMLILSDLECCFFEPEQCICCA